MRKFGMITQVGEKHAVGGSAMLLSWGGGSAMPLFFIFYLLIRTRRAMWYVAPASSRRLGPPTCAHTVWKQQPKFVWWSN